MAYLDFVIGETTCDGKTKVYEIFNEYKETIVLEVPHTKSTSAAALCRSEMDRLSAKVEAATGRKITAVSLCRAIDVVNAKRAALDRLNRLRAADPAPISGREALLINQGAFYDDPIRFTQKVNELCDKLETRVGERGTYSMEDAPQLETRIRAFPEILR